MGNHKITRLKDEEISAICGGTDGFDTELFAGVMLAAGFLAAPVTFVCSIARLVNSKKAKKAKEQNARISFAKYSKSVDKLDVATAVFGGMTVAGIAGYCLTPNKGKL